MLTFAARQSVGQLSDDAKARRWRVIVIVPERHLDRPRIPDPAVETAVCRALIDAGYKVVDQERIAELRYSEQVDRIIKGGPGADPEVKRIGRKIGADLLVVGEAFTQEVSRFVEQTELGQVLRIRCRARIELTAMRVDTAERIYSDSIQKTGPPDATVELSSKACLEEAADELSPRLLQKLDKLAMPSSRYVELQVRGIGGAARAKELEKSIAKLPGVLDIAPGGFEANTWSAEVKVTVATMRDLPSMLESNSLFKRFHLKVQSASGSRVIVSAK
jgi:hypothetical protein